MLMEKKSGRIIKQTSRIRISATTAQVIFDRVITEKSIAFFFIHWPPSHFPRQNLPR